MSTEDALSGIGLGKPAESAPFTQEQERRLRELMGDVVREYWTTDDIKRISQDAAKKQAEWIIEDGMKVKIAEAVHADPAKMVEQLFRHSGMMVKTQASQEFDTIVNAMLQDEDSGLPEAVRQYTKEHFEELVARAIKEIVAAMVAQFVKQGAAGLALSTQDVMRQAFMNASMNTRF